MKKSTYLIISGLLSLRYLDYFMSSDIVYIIMMLWAAFGFMNYRGYSDLYSKKNVRIVFAFLILFFLSALAPVFMYNQDFVYTLIAYRGNLVVLYLLTLLKIKPTENDFYDSFKTLAKISFLLAVLSLIFPQFFLGEKEAKYLAIRQHKGSLDILTAWPGSMAVVFSFFMSLSRAIKSDLKSEFLWCTGCFVYIFLMQNRSTLVGTLPFYLYGIFKVNFKYKKLIVCVLVLSTCGYVYNIFTSLIEETVEQLGDEKYNRWQAIQFYLVEHKYNVYTVLFGNGSPCAGSEYLKYINNAVTSRFAILSDIGLLGSFFFYGLITMALFYSIIFKGAFSKAMPLYVKFYCLWIIFVPTIHSLAHGMAYYGTVQSIIVIYFVLYNNSINNLSVKLK